MRKINQEILSKGAFHFREVAPNVNIRVGHWRTDGQSRGAILLAGGRSEFIEKYVEVIERLLARGLDVVSFDWRCQGLSTRTLPNRSKHHLDTFDSMVKDLGVIIEKELLANTCKPYFFLAHSMGGHVFLRYLAESPSNPFSAGMLSAPMIDILYGPFPRGLGRAIASAACAFGGGKRYALMQGDYGPRNRSRLVQRTLTSDTERFAREHALIDANPDLALGGVTNGWLVAAANSIDVLRRPDTAAAIKTPVLIAQAECDQIVDNRAQTRFAEGMPNGQLLVVEGAQHEILMERDDIQAPFWSAFDAFLSPHLTN